MRTTFVKTLTEIADDNPNVWLLCGDLGYSVLEQFAARHPKRYINVGVAEQNLAGMAAGIALSGKTVFIYSIGNFPTLRCLEQLRNDVCYSRRRCEGRGGRRGLRLWQPGLHASRDRGRCDHERAAGAWTCSRPAIRSKCRA